MTPSEPRRGGVGTRQFLWAPHEYQWDLLGSGLTFWSSVRSLEPPNVSWIILKCAPQFIHVYLKKLYSDKLAHGQIADCKNYSLTRPRFHGDQPPNIKYQKILGPVNTTAMFLNRITTITTTFSLTCKNDLELNFILFMVQWNEITNFGLQNKYFFNIILCISKL